MLPLKSYILQRSEHVTDNMRSESGEVLCVESLSKDVVCGGTVIGIIWAFQEDIIDIDAGVRASAL